MKFVALALALLLAVGSQSASLQADAPSQLAHIRSVVDVYVNQFKDSIKKAVEQLDDAEYKDFKVALAQNLDNFHTQIKTYQGHVSPLTDSLVSTIVDATAEFRTSVMNDIEALKTDLEPKRAKLREVLHKHIEEYRGLLQPTLSEYYTKHTAEMDALKAKLEPIVEELRTKVATNVEETKAALVPIVESLRAKGHERLENLKELVGPYVEEYKDQLKQAYSQARNVNTAELATLREKIAPLIDNIKSNFQTIAETIAASITKS